MKYCGSTCFLKKKGAVLTAFLALMLVALPRVVSAQTVTSWFAKPENSAFYSTIANEIKAMAQQFQSMGLSDSILTSRLDEAFRKRVNPDILLASLKIDTQRAALLSSMLRENGFFPSDKKAATTTVEQMLILMRAGLTETEMRSALQAGVAKSGKSAKAMTRALAALGAIAAANAQSGMTEEERLGLASELISSSLSENQFASMVVARKALHSSEGRTSESSSKASDNTQGNTSESGTTEGGQSSGGHVNTPGGAQGAQGSRNESNGAAGQGAGSHGKK